MYGLMPSCMDSLKKLHRSDCAAADGGHRSAAGRGLAAAATSPALSVYGVAHLTSYQPVPDEGHRAAGRMLAAAATSPAPSVYGVVASTQQPNRHPIGGGAPDARRPVREG